MKNWIKILSTILIFGLLSMGLIACTQPDEPEDEPSSEIGGEEKPEEKPEDEGGNENGNENENEGVVCGYGAVGGRLVFAFAQDESAMKGAVDGRHAEKIAMLYEKAVSVGAPIVGMFDSAGAVVFDGAAALSGYGVLLDTVASAAGVVPQIALVHGKCVGTMAAIASLFDFTVVTEGASLYVANEESNAAKAAALTAANETDAFGKVKTLLSYLPDDNCSAAEAAVTGDDPNRAVALGAKATAEAALAAVVDSGLFLEVYGGCATEVKVGFATLGDQPCVVAAIDGKATQMVTHDQMRLDMKIMEHAFKSAELNQTIKFEY